MLLSSFILSLSTVVVLFVAQEVDAVFLEGRDLLRNLTLYSLEARGKTLSC